MTEGMTTLIAFQELSPALCVTPANRMRLILVPQVVIPTAPLVHHKCIMWCDDKGWRWI